MFTAGASRGRTCGRSTRTCSCRPIRTTCATRSTRASRRRVVYTSAAAPIASRRGAHRVRRRRRAVRGRGGARLSRRTASTAFQSHEADHATRPLPPGRSSRCSRPCIACSRPTTATRCPMRLRTALVTARSAPAHERADPHADGLEDPRRRGDVPGRARKGRVPARVRARLLLRRPDAPRANRRRSTCRRATCRTASRTKNRAR